jgi:hypothetical protein
MTAKKKATRRKITSNESVFRALIKSLLEGMIRTNNAHMGLLLAERHFLRVNHHRPQPIPTRDEVPTSFDAESFKHVITASLLVYCVSMFDVFLSDLNRALLMMNIGALGKNCLVPILVPIEVLASPQARIDIIKKEVEKRVRAVAYKSFEERLEFLRLTFTLKFNLSEKQRIDLQRIAGLRNKLVHDQSFYFFDLDRRHRPSIRVRSTSKQSVKVRFKDVNEATGLFVALGSNVYNSVRTDILKLPSELDN